MDVLGKIGIDGWSVLLYLVNFGILAAVLTKFLYRPLLSYMDDRRERVRRALEEVETLQREFRAEMEKRGEESGRVVGELRGELERARSYADEKARQALSDAGRERERMIAETKAEMVDLKRDVLIEAEKRAVAVMEKVVLAVLRDKVPEAVAAESVADAWRDALKKEF